MVAERCAILVLVGLIEFDWPVRGDLIYQH